jgi:hypothetical protein
MGFKSAFKELRILGDGKKFIASTGIRSPDRPARSVVIVPTELSLLQISRWDWVKVRNPWERSSSCVPNFESNIARTKGQFVII